MLRVAMATPLASLHAADTHVAARALSFDPAVATRDHMVARTVPTFLLGSVHVMCYCSSKRRVQYFYCSSKRRVQYNRHLSKCFYIDMGVAQGDTLSCILFDFYIDGHQWAGAAGV